MAKNTFRCRLVTPAAALVDGDVTYASVPAWDGLIGFLAGRSAFLGKLGTGELRLEMADGGGAGKSFMVDGGFIRMANNQMTILAEKAVPADQITPADIEVENKAASVEEDSAKRARAKARVRVMTRLSSGRR